MTDDRDDEDLPDFDWPEPGDSLAPILGPTGNRPRAYRKASVNLTFLDQWNTYIAGYAEGAKVLIQRALDAGREQDILIYPILFLCHHHIELALKKAIDAASAVYCADAPMRATHNLQCLWQDLDKCMKVRGGRVSAAEEKRWRAVGKCIRQLNALGIEGEAFRYPVSRAGEAHALRNPLAKDGEPASTIDLHELGRLMSKIGNLLDGLTDMLAAELEAKRDMEHDAAGGWR